MRERGEGAVVPVQPGPALRVAPHRLVRRCGLELRLRQLAQERGRRLKPEVEARVPPEPVGVAALRHDAHHVLVPDRSRPDPFGHFVHDPSVNRREPVRRAELVPLHGREQCPHVHRLRRLGRKPLKGIRIPGMVAPVAQEGEDRRGKVRIRLLPRHRGRSLAERRKREVPRIGIRRRIPVGDPHLVPERPFESASVQRLQRLAFLVLQERHQHMLDTATGAPRRDAQHLAAERDDRLNLRINRRLQGRHPPRNRKEALCLAQKRNRLDAQPQIRREERRLVGVELDIRQQQIEEEVLVIRRTRTSHKEKELVTGPLMNGLDFCRERSSRDVALLHAVEPQRIVVHRQHRIVAIPEDNPIPLEELCQGLDHRLVHATVSSTPVLESS